MSRQLRRGFTLIEILIVVAIMAVLLAMAGLSAGGMMDAIRMKDAIETARYQVENARQLAMTQNREVIIRIYREPNEFNEPVWRTVEFGISDVVTNPLDPEYTDPTSASYIPPFKRIGSAQRLPTGYVFHPSSTYSTLLGNNSALYSGEETGSDNVSREYKAFTCQPDGKSNLPGSENWTLTVVKERDIQGSSALPPNFAVLELNANTSRMRVYRP